MDVQALIPLHCPLCAQEMKLLNFPIRGRDRWYHRCRSCGFIYLAPAHHLSAEAEKERYLQHQNSNDNGYRDYLGTFIEAAVIPHLKPGAEILDFGSGPVPALTSLLNSQGFSCHTFDPYFSPAPAWQSRSYDAVILHEVAEHLADPAAVFTAAGACIRNGGFFMIRTRFLESCADFASWWYRMDATHISFYTEIGLRQFMASQGFSQILFRTPDIAVFQKKAH